MFRSRSEKSYADMKMKDFPDGMYVMSDDTIIDFDKGWDVESNFADPAIEPEEFKKDIETVAWQLNLNPREFLDKNGFKNIGDLCYDYYDYSDGEGYPVDGGGVGGSGIYYDYETVREYCYRVIRNAVPVKRIPDSVADDWRVW